MTLAFCSNVGMDISDIWGEHLRAIVDGIAPGEGRGVKTPAYRAVAELTRFEKEYVYQVYTGRKRVGSDFASALERAYANGRPAGWINVALHKSNSAPDELPANDTPEKREGLGLNEFLNYLHGLYPQAPLTPGEIKEEASAYQEYAAKRVAHRLLKQKFGATDAVTDARVEAAFGAAQDRERRGAKPDQQLVGSPLSERPNRRSSQKRKDKP